MEPIQRPAASSRMARLLISGAIACLYVSACATPAIYLDEGGQACTAIRMGSPLGVVALLLGWIPPFSVPWAANLFLFGGWGYLLFGRFKRATWLGGIGVALALTTWLYQFPHMLNGYYLWQASFVVLTIAAAAMAMVDSSAQPLPILEEIAE